MTVEQYLNSNYVPEFRIITFINWKTQTLYDSRFTKYDVPGILYYSIVENVYNENGMIEIEV